MEKQYLPIEIWNIIFHYLDFKHKHLLKSTCKEFNNKLVITSLYEISCKFMQARSRNNQKIAQPNKN